MVVLAAVLAACGGDSPGGPSQSGSGGNSGGSGGGNAACGGSAVGPLGCAKGLVTATIDGATWVGGVPTGGATYQPVAGVPALGLPAQDFITMSATGADLTTLTLSARAKLGRAEAGLGVIDPETRQPTVHNANLALRTSNNSAGAWNTNILGGSGSITLTSVSTTGATGSFSYTMVPQAGTVATGNKVVQGTFTVTF